ncbi:MAG: DUF1653 domain-containing protein [Candidatus Nomurabacteria bacterium]|nr:DUF1653 domain-containing protein [Candidatus Nomurabacteria bacterium]
MRRKTERELEGMLAEAAKSVKVGRRYRHSKTGGEYTVVELVLWEATEEVAVIYRPEYGDEKFLWARTLAVFLEDVEIDGVVRKRFELMEESK